MTMIEQLKEELKNMTDDEKKQLTDLLKEEPEQQPVEVRQLGEAMFPRRRGPRGEDLTEEQYYDFKHPMTGLWVEGLYDYSVDMTGKEKRIYHTKDQIAEHNQKIRDEWIQEKRRYAAEHGLTFSDEYNPPVDPRNRNYY